MARSPSRTRVALYGVLGFLVVGWLQQSGFSTLVELRDAWRREAALESEVRDLEAANSRLAEEIDALNDNGDAVERLAREKLRLAREGEIIILVPDKR